MLKCSTEKMGEILTIILRIGVIVFIPILIAIPFLLENNISLFHTILIIYLNGVLMLGIAHQFIKLFQSLKKKESFKYFCKCKSGAKYICDKCDEFLCDLCLGKKKHINHTNKIIKISEYYPYIKTTLKEFASELDKQILIIKTKN